MLLKFIMRDADDVIVEGTPTVTADGEALTPTGTSALWQVDAPLGSLVTCSLAGAVTLDVQIPSVDPETLALDSTVTAASARGSGADEVTLTITLDDGVTPVADCGVWVTSIDADGAPIVAGTLTTNSDGEVTFLLDDGAEYYCYRQKDGVDFATNPFPFTAAAD